MDMQNADAIMIMGSNMAECHPVAFRWVMKAKAKGAKLIHVDPRFTRTSAMANIYTPLRAGSDIVFLGALVNYIINSKRWNEEPFFKEYVLNYTNAPSLINPDYKGPDDLEGLFSGWDPQAKKYNTATWAYQSEQAATAGQPRAGQSPQSQTQGLPTQNGQQPAPSGQQPGTQQPNNQQPGGQPPPPQTPGGQPAPGPAQPQPGATAMTPEIKQMIDLGYARLDEQRFQLPSQGLRYADWAAEKFLRS